MAFTRLADRRLERRIESDLAFLTDHIRRIVPRRSLAAIILGGGYGRGDGGMRLTPYGPVPLDDYDLLVVQRAFRRLARGRCAV